MSGSSGMGLHVAGLEGLGERRERITGGDELVRDVAGEPGVGDGARDGAPVQLLRVVELVAPRHASGVEVRDMTDVLPDRPDYVAFHDLHVVDVVQQLHARRADGLDHLGAECGAIASASLFPLRFPNIAMTLGTPCRPARGIACSSSRSSIGWLARSSNPVAMKSSRLVGYPIEQTSPCSCTMGQSSGCRRSMPARPMRLAARHKSGSGIRP